jgi:hypothetical protein
MNIIKRIFGLMVQRAPKQQYFLELGSYFIRKGTGYKVGQPFEYSQIKRKKGDHKIAKKELYISNLFYNFKENKITYKLDKNPILNRSEKAG